MKATGPTRIVFLVGTLNLGGIERLTTDISIALKKGNQWEPVVCCLIAKEGPFVKRLEECHVEVFECSLSNSNPLSFALRLAALLRSLDPNLIHSHVNFSMPWQILGSRLAGVHNIFFTQHNEYRYWKDHRLARLRIWGYFRACWPFISAYTAVSHGVQASVANLSRRPAEDFHVIHNPVDVEIFRPNPKAGLETRLEMGIREDEILIGNIGRLTEQKGHGILLQAAKQILQTAPNARFVMAGEGPLAVSLIEQATALGIQDKVIFLGSHAQVQTLYPAFDCYVSASLWEGFPITIVEAMASGLPIVATKIGGTVEALGVDYPYLVPPEDPFALAQAITKLITDPDYAKILGEHVRSRAVDEFSLDAIVQQYTALYQESLRQSRLI